MVFSPVVWPSGVLVKVFVCEVTGLTPSHFTAR